MALAIKTSFNLHEKCVTVLLFTNKQTGPHEVDFVIGNRGGGGANFKISCRKGVGYKRWGRNRAFSVHVSHSLISVICIGLVIVM